MRLFEFLHKYFGFNKRERNGIILLLAIILVLIFVRVFFPIDSTGPEIKITKLEALQKKSDQKRKVQERTSQATGKINTDLNSGTILFPFDPNTITTDQALQLGFPAKLTGTLDKFRSKGGKFRSKDDLKKLYGMKEELFAKLESYILIPPPEPKNTPYSSEPFAKK